MHSPDHDFLRGLWTEYCRGGSIYAMRHLVAELHIGERVWWFIWIGLALVACLMSMVQLYEKWNENPVVISYDGRFLPVWAVPFPAVTVCPIARTQVELFNSSDVYFRFDEEGISDNEYVRLRALLHVCPMMSDFYEFNATLAVNYVQILENIAIPFRSLYSGCKFRKYFLDCNVYWSKSITDGGVCYTFNAIDAESLLRTDNLHHDYLYSESYLDSSNWTLEDGYLDDFQLETYPLRPVGGGMDTGLMLVMKTRKVDIDYFCEGPVIGYKIAIHSPDEIPSVQHNYYRLSHNSKLSLIAQPELTYITPDLKKHPYSRRQCYFSDERYLRYFKVYNRKNCLDECISNQTAQECGCVGFYSPRGPEVRICDGRDLFCPGEAISKLLEKLNVSQRRSEIEAPCGCLPSCTTLQYEVEISNLPWDFEAFARALGAPTEVFDVLEPAGLVVSLKSKWLLPMKRQELFGIPDMMAKFGGLFGLVMGASVISFLELVYYCIIRPWRNDYPARSAGWQVFPWTA
nr:pickpocket protein 28-like [Aedes albopictus]